MSTNLMKASNQWASRPDDQRFLTLESLHKATKAHANRSEEYVSPNEEIEVEAVGDDGVVLKTEDGIMVPSNFSFGQLATAAGAPAHYLRKLHPELAAENLNFGLWGGIAGREDLMFYSAKENAKAKDGDPLELRAVTSPGYGRIYDHQVAEAVINMNQDGRWKIPSASYDKVDPKRATTLYASDRDVFIFMVDPETTIDVNGESLFRGFITWNSEVGQTVLGFMTFLYRYICDNRIIWGAEGIQEVRMRHTLNAPERFEEFQEELPKYVNDYLGSSAKADQALIRKALAFEVGENDEKVAEWVRDESTFSLARAKAIVTKANETEGSAGNLWNVVQGATALARDEYANTNVRLEMERTASSLLNKAAA